MYASVTYDKPVLFDQSTTIKENFLIHEKKAVFIVDQELMNESLNDFIDQLEKSDIDYINIPFSNEKELERALAILHRQTMGTQLYIAAKWDDAVTVFTEAVEAGFTEDEIEVKIQGQKRRYVYCMKCYTLNEANFEPTTTCSNCNIGLTVGPFFSKVRKGYIGYLIPQENNN